MRVLIIEDEDRLRHMMRLALAEQYEVGEASTGEAALDVFSDGRWDVVLLDQRLPGIDGLETLRRLRQRDPGVCVVMITAFASIELAVEAMKLGATDFLRKPVAPDALRGALAAAVHVKSERQAGRLPAAPVAPADKPGIVHMTLNGFQMTRRRSGEGIPSRSPYDHPFTVVQHATGEQHEVTVSIDPGEVERVDRLTRRVLKPQGAFWSQQVERFLGAHLWVEGHAPEGGRLTLTDVSLDTIDLAAAWTAD